MTLSKKIEIIIKILEQCKSDYDWYEARRVDAELEGNNISHEMEGKKSENSPLPNYKERARLATVWQKTLLTRRAAKNNIAINQHLAEFVNSNAGMATLNDLKQILGKTRKAEAAVENRKYTVRKTDNAPMNPVLQKNINALINEWKKGSSEK